MNTARRAYTGGASTALRQYGFKTAANLMERRLPEGPEHLGAERLAKMLSRLPDEGPQKPGRERRDAKLERDTRWGSRQDLSGSAVWGESGSLGPTGGW